MHQTLTRGCEDATLAWLKGALEHAYSQGQCKTLAYLEAVIADMVFEMKVIERRASVVE